MGLIISRRVDEEFVLFAKPGVDAQQIAEELAKGVTIRVHAIDRGKTWIEIRASREINVLRSELIPEAAEQA